MVLAPLALRSLTIRRRRYRAGVNRLARETSPYLRQHADNPVDWYPWGEDAFAEARRRDVPILLSVGYSACHWCHVMAHESFEDADTAAVMNELFVNIKVDREERPDVDAVYMEATQAMTGTGGWPMTVFMTPDGEPFFCGTYFPAQAMPGRPSFVQLCRAVDDAWRTKRDELAQQSAQLVDAIRRDPLAGRGRLRPGLAEIDRAVDQLLTQHDDQRGGFGGAPKFPGTMSLDLLLRAHVRTGREDALRAVDTSLDAMAAGGIYDHLGGGFARYSVDAVWLVPHFEKMLYDQALLTRVYLHAWQITGADRHRQVLDETIGYVLRDLRHERGGFFSAEDADSEGEEGRFYLWTPEQFREVLGDRADAAAAWWGLGPKPNFEGRTILNRMHGRGELARPPEIEAARQELLAARSTRVRPGLDDKVLTEWNALMIASVAEAAAATGNADWMAAAEQAATFLVEELRPDGRWLRSWQSDGGARHLAYAADHAALVDAFTRLAEASGRARWIDEARSTADALLDLFRDDDGSFMTTGRDGEALVARSKDVMDNATPAANTTAAVALLRLGALTGEARYQRAAEDVLELLGELAGSVPSAFANLLAAAEMDAVGLTEVAVVGDAPELVAAVQAAYRPNVVLAWGEPYDSPLWEGRAVPSSEGRSGLAYVCRDYACQAPVTETGALEAQLAGRRGA
ncbi:MAG: thioredoxin domain-containing protein [Acidimicrobiia bacterium]|nr:thioredoxin domain-containing protein [Acidimicrobiia bacterium]